MYFQEAGAASGTGLVQQTVQIVASHDLTLFVGRRASKTKVFMRLDQKLPGSWK